MISPLRPRHDRRTGRSASRSTSSCAAAAPRRSRTRPHRDEDDELSADAVAAGAGRPRRRPSARSCRSGCPGPTGRGVVPEGHAGRVWIRGRLIDGAGSRCRTRWSRPGRPTRTAASTTRTIRAEPCRGKGFAGSRGQRPTRRRRTRSARSSRAPSPTAPGGSQAPHIDVSVFARGLLNRVVTRLYFADEAAANAADPVLPRCRTTPRARRSSPTAGRRRLPPRHRAAGRARDASSPSELRERVDPTVRETRCSAARSRAAGRRPSGAAWLRALLDVEAALARAAGSVAAVPAAVAGAIAPRARTVGVRRRGDLAAAAPSGNSVVPLVARSAERSPAARPRTCTSAPPARTSWTRAMMLVARRAVAADPRRPRPSQRTPARPLAAEHRRHADGRPHPDAARRAHDVRAEGRGLADRTRRARRSARPAAAGLARAARRSGRHAGRPAPRSRPCATRARRPTSDCGRPRAWHTDRRRSLDLAGALGDHLGGCRHARARRRAARADRGRRGHRGRGGSRWLVDDGPRTQPDRRGLGSAPARFRAPGLIAIAVRCDAAGAPARARALAGGMGDASPTCSGAARRGAGWPTR